MSIHAGPSPAWKLDEALSFEAAAFLKATPGTHPKRSCVSILIPVVLNSQSLNFDCLGMCACVYMHS